MIRNASSFRTGLVLLCLLSAPVPKVGAVPQDAPASDAPSIEERLAAARAAFEASARAFDESLPSKDAARVNSAFAALRPALDAVSAVQPDAPSVRGYNERVARFKAFADAVTRKPGLMSLLDAAEADAGQGAWQAAESALRRMDPQVAACEPALTEPELESIRSRIGALRAGVRQWQSDQADLAKQAAEASAIAGELGRADRALARAASEPDFDASAKRLDESDALIAGAEARLAAVTGPAGQELSSRAAELRADLQRSRDALLSGRAAADMRARVGKLARGVALVAPAPESQAEIARLDAECDTVQKALEADKQVPAAASAELSDTLRSVKARLADIRRALDAEAARKPLLESLASAEQALAEGTERLAAADYSAAEAAATRASDILRRAGDSLKPIPDAASRGEMERRLGGLGARSQRLSASIPIARRVAELDAAIDRAETDIKDMASGNWAADRSALEAAVAAPQLPEASKARGQRTIERLSSIEAKSEADKVLTDPIDAAIKAGNYGMARAEVDALRVKMGKMPLSAEHVASLRTQIDAHLQRIASGEFWRLFATIGAVVAIVLVAAVAALAWLRTRTGGSSVLGADLRTARTRVNQLALRLEQDRERATSSAAVKSDATERLEKFRQLAADGVPSPIEGAERAGGEWRDALDLCHQLVALGDADSAKAMLEAVGRARILPAAPRFKLLVERGGPLKAKDSVRRSRGCRAVEAAQAWAAVWKGVSPASRDAIAKNVDSWLKIAVDWLPEDQDVFVFLERAEFAASQGKRADALALLSGERDSAVARLKSIKSPANGGSAQGKRMEQVECRVHLLAAELELDLASVVSLRGTSTECAPQWPVVDRYSRPEPSMGVQAPLGAPPAGGVPPTVDPAARILRARNHLQSAEAALAAVPSANGGSAVHERASLKFQLDAGFFRVELGSGDVRAEGTLADRVLGEPDSTASAAFEFDIPLRTRARTRTAIDLRAGWSRLQPQLDSRQINGPADRRMVRDLRLNWVSWCLRRGEQFGRDNPQVRAGFQRKAAWLTARYWLCALEDGSPEVAPARAQLEVFAKQILDVQSGGPIGGKDSIGPNAWKPAGEVSASEDQLVFQLICEVAGGTEPDPMCARCGRSLRGLPPGSPCPSCSPKCLSCGRDTVAGFCTVCQVPPPPPSPPPAPSLQNIWLLPREAPGAASVDGKPVINSLQVIDPSNSATSVDGMYAWIDTGGRAPVRAVGVFGYDLDREYSVPVKSVRKPARELFGSSSVIGVISQLAEFSFDGLKDIVGQFAVVLSRPARALPFGGSASTHPQDGDEVARIDVAGFVARPVPGKQPAATIPVELIERSLFDISTVISAIGVESKPLPQAVAPAAAYGLSNPDGAEAWNALAELFCEELGAAQERVKDELLETAMKSVEQGRRAAKVTSFASGIIDLDFIRSMVRQSSLRDEKLRDADAKAAWGRLDPTVRAAMERLIRKFAERHPECMSAQQLERQFGIRIGEAFKQKCAADACGAELPIGATRCPKCGKEVGPVQCVKCQRALPPGSIPGGQCAACTGVAGRSPSLPVQDPAGLKARFDSLRDRVLCYRYGHWPYPQNPALARMFCEQWLEVLQPRQASAAVAPEERADLGQLIADIRRLMGDLPPVS